MTSSDHLEDNLFQAARLIAQAAREGSSLVILPEMFSLFGLSSHDKVTIQETYGSGVIQDFLSRQARENNIWIVGGTIPIKSSTPDKIFAACLVFNHEGIVVARYEKIHLFDVCVEGKEYRESDTVEAGNEIVVVDTPVGKLGLAVCYDLRFSEMFRALVEKGAEIIAIPTAFTVSTGEAHWEILMRARAIECQCYVIGACQTGTHASGRETYGHSMIIDPWGTILNALPKGVGCISAEINLNHLVSVREKIPMLACRENENCRIKSRL